MGPLVFKFKYFSTASYSSCGTLFLSWWRHQMETFSALLALCAGNSPVPVNSPHKDQWRGAVMFSLICARNKRLSKQPWGWWFETPSWSLWRQCNGSVYSDRSHTPGSIAAPAPTPVEMVSIEIEQSTRMPDQTLICHHAFSIWVYNYVIFKYECVKSSFVIHIFVKLSGTV